MRHRFQRQPALNQNSVLGRSRKPGNDCHWHGEDERTRGGHHEHRHGTNGISTPRPGRSRKRDGRRQKHHGVSIRQARHRGAGTLRGRNQTHDPGIRALGRAPRRRQMEGFAGVRRSAHDVVADLLLYRHGFAGQGRLVEHRNAFHDRSVDRHHIALANDQAIARLDRLQRDFFEPAVPKSHRAPRHTGEERRHLPAGATLGEALEILPSGIHHRDHGGGEVFGEEKRRKHRECGDDVQAHVAAA